MKLAAFLLFLSASFWETKPSSHWTDGELISGVRIFRSETWDR